MPHPTSPIDLERTAGELHGLLGRYRRGDRSIAQMIEPLLRDYHRKYRPRIDREKAAFELQLMSAAWQIFLDRPTDSVLRQMAVTIGKVRREYNSNDRWPLSAVATASKIRTELESKRRDDDSKTNRIFEILAEGYHKPDKRRGMRKSRRELLAEGRERAQYVIASRATRGSLSDQNVIPRIRPSMFMSFRGNVT